MLVVMLYTLRPRPSRRSKRVYVVGAALLFSLTIIVGGVSYMVSISSNPVALKLSSAIAHSSSNRTTINQKKPNSKSKNSPKINNTESTSVLGVKLNTNSVNATASIGIGNCNPGLPQRNNLARAESPQLKKLAEYEQVCSGAIFDKISFFVPTPTTTAQAISSANEAAVTLKEFAKYGVKPVVIMEPTYNDTVLNLSAYSNGVYDNALDAYFAQLKKSGLSDEQLGTWVFFPEGNTPAWGDVDSGRFVTNVTKTASALRKYFAAGDTSILLNSATFANGQSWDDSSYVSLSSYVAKIPKGLINSLGIQGFPWAAPANSDWASLTDPSVYLPAGIITEAASSLGVNKVWLNTGTFSVAYANQTGKQVTISPQQRLVQLNATLTQAGQLKSQGLQVAIHLFAENKSATSEAIDWSYWKDANLSGEYKSVLKTFVGAANAQNIQLWLYDSAQ